MEFNIYDIRKRIKEATTMPEGVIEIMRNNSRISSDLHRRIKEQHDKLRRAY